MAEYLKHYLLRNRPGEPIPYIIICAAHPLPKILVVFCGKEQFFAPGGETHTQKNNPLTGEVHEVTEVQENAMRFNGVNYEIVLKEGPTEDLRWCDEAKFQALFDELGRAKEDVLFFDLVEFEAEEAKKAESEGKKKAKKEKKKAKRAASRIEAKEGSASKDVSETVQAEAADEDVAEKMIPEKKLTYAEKAAKFQVEKHRYSVLR